MTGDAPGTPPMMTASSTLTSPLWSESSCRHRTSNLGRFQKTMEPRKKKKNCDFTFYTGCSIGILVMVYYNPTKLGSIIPYIPKNNEGFFHCSMASCHKENHETIRMTGWICLMILLWNLYISCWQKDKQSPLNLYIDYDLIILIILEIEVWIWLFSWNSRGPISRNQKAACCGAQVVSKVLISGDTCPQPFPVVVLHDAGIWGVKWCDMMWKMWKILQFPHWILVYSSHINVQLPNENRNS